MKQRIGCVSVLVRDYDEAIAYYTRVLGFRLMRDDALDQGKRWVIVSPPGASECGLLLARAKNEAEIGAIGRQTGGRVFLFLETDDFWRDYRTFLARGVCFREAPREETYGTVAVFQDFYGNRWDLLQLKSTSSEPPKRL
jgi:catechol 2,3-dioxygenase-like lactoylglutathione lyase family enzyme